jgi:hypothetical protein
MEVRRFHTFYFKFFLFLGLFFSLGCAAPSEKEERRQNAFDISGNYTPMTFSPTHLSFKISNETGRHDIKIEMNRDQISLLEQEAYEKKGLQIEKIKSFMGNPFVLGEGYYKDNLIGGENISDDFGETSKILVEKSFQYDPSHQLIYTFSAVIKKSEFILHGSFSISLNDSQTYTTLVSFKFDCQNGTQFFQQYFGSWSGKVTPKNIEEKSLSSFKLLKIEKSTNEEFTAQPSTQALFYEGKEYRLDKKSYSNQDLISQLFPSLEIRFVLNTNERIVFFGNMFSLGNLSGSVVKLDRTSEETIANFQFKKD